MFRHENFSCSKIKFSCLDTKIKKKTRLDTNGHDINTKFFYIKIFKLQFLSLFFDTLAPKYNFFFIFELNSLSLKTIWCLLKKLMTEFSILLISISYNCLKGGIQFKKLKILFNISHFWRQVTEQVQFQIHPYIQGKYLGLSRVIFKFEIFLSWKMIAGHDFPWKNFMFFR